MGQQRETKFSLVIPEFIPVNSSFDVSLTLTNNYPEADEFELILYPDDRLILNRADFKSFYESFKINADENTTDPAREYYSIKINLNENSRVTGTVFQVLMNFKTSLQKSAILKIQGFFKNNDSTVAYLYSENQSSPDEEFLVYDINFYKPQKVADRALLLGENNYFRITPGIKFTHDLLTEFWLKYNETGTTFLKIFRKNFPQPDYELSINEFQMMSVSSVLFNQSFINPYFAGRKSWYHMSILFSAGKREISFYCNGTLISKNDLPGIFEYDNLQILFNNQAEDGNIMIDQ